MGRLTTRRTAVRIAGDDVPRSRIDTLAVEEPLEIRVDGTPFTLTMRTPGHDVELAHGLLQAEGVIRAASDVVTARFCADVHELNVLELDLADGVEAPPASAQRALPAYGGCGLCGASTIDAVLARPRPAGRQEPPRVDGPAVRAALAGLRDGQKVFASTGGVHGAAAADPEGRVGLVREDIGRHNAVDKVLGRLLMDEAPPPAMLVVSSRASFEIVAKAAMGGVGTLVCVSAPSSLAVEAAEQLGLTLVAFAREDRMTVYTGPSAAAS